MNDIRRFRKIKEYQLFPQEVDDNLSELMRSLSALMDMPIALVSIVDKEKQFFKGKAGLDADSTPVEHSFCQYVVAEEAPYVVNDALNHKAFKNNPLVVGEPNIRFYAGVPLKLDDVTVGSVCVIDTQPRDISESQLTVLERLSAHVSGYLSLLQQHQEMLDEHSLFDDTPAVILKWHYTNSLELDYVSNNIESLFGIPVSALRERTAVIEDFLDTDGTQEFNFMLSNHISGVDLCDVQLELHPESRPSCWVKLLTKGFRAPNGTLNTVHGMLIDNTSTRFFERRLNEANNQMKLVLEASALGTWNYDVANDVNKVNQRWCDMIGIEYEDFDPSHYFWRTLVHPADIHRVELALREHLQNKTDAYDVEYRIRHRNGHWVWVEAYGRAVEFDANGNPTRVTGTHRDVTDRKTSELHEERQRKLLSFVNKAQTVYLNEKDLSKACRDILNDIIEVAGSQFAFIGQMQARDNKPVLFIHAISEMSWNDHSSALLDDYHKNRLYFESFDNLFGQVIKTGEVVLTNAPQQHAASTGTPAGHPKITRFLGLPIKLRGEVVGMLGLANKFEKYTGDDVTFLQPLLDSLGALFYAVELDQARIRAEEQLKNLAMTDPLTGIANRRAFGEFCAQLENQKPKVTIAIIDIDYFKKVNDTYGHAAGDAVIISLANTLKERARSDDFVARMGGEEFAVALFTKSRADADQWLNELREYIEALRINFEGNDIAYTISVGAAYITESLPYFMDTSLDLADKALYEAKGAGRNQVVWSRQ